MNRESVNIQQEMSSSGRTRFEAYADLVIGKRGVGNFLRYELVIFCSSTLPGAAGLWLRSKLYPLLLKNCGRNVVFGRNVTLRHPHKISIGNDVVIDDNCLLDAKGKSNKGIEIANGCYIGRNSILSCKNGDIALGRKVNIGFNCEIFSGSRVELGDNTLVAAYTYFIGGDHDKGDENLPVSEQGRTSRGIVSGDNCWFGAGVKVLDGRKIGRNCLVGAGAVVTKDIPEHSVAKGVPARAVARKG